MKNPVIVICFFILLVSFNLYADDDVEIINFGSLSYPITINVTEEQAVQSKTEGILFLSPESKKRYTPFNTVLFNGMATNENWQIEISYLRDDISWSEWKPVFVKNFKNGRYWAKFQLQKESIAYIKFRILKKSLSQSLNMQIYAIEAFDKTEKIENFFIPQKYSISAYGDSIEKPDVVSRQEWDALPPVGTQIPHDPYRMTYHHTAMLRVVTLAEGIAEMQFIQDFHINGRGWKDIAYHYCVDDSGRIYAGVPDTIIGTHNSGGNTGNIGVSMLGNFVADTPPDLMIQACIDLFSYLAFHFHINPDSLLGHRDYVLTTVCPGDSGYAQMDYIRNRVKRNLASGAPYVNDPFPKPFSIDVNVNTSIAFSVLDDVEGVDSSSIKIWVNDSLVTPTSITGNPNKYEIYYDPLDSFQDFKDIDVNIEAIDLSAPAESLFYSYTFRTKAVDVLAETFSMDSLTNGAINLVGSWNTETVDIALPGLNDGDILWTVDSTAENSARIYPNVLEGGNYVVSMAFDVAVLGMNSHYRIVNSHGRSNNEYIEYNGTFAGKWGQLGNGPVYFDAGNPSSAYIELLPIPDYYSIMIIDAFRLQKRNTILAPAVPELKYVKINDSGDVEIAWNLSLEGDIKGYRLYESLDGRTWGNPLVDESVISANDSVYTLPAPASDTTYFYRVVAVDTNSVIDDGGFPQPIFSNPSDIYGLSLKGTNRILIVDNFDRRSSWSRPQHFFIRSHGHAISLNGLGFESCVNDAVQNGDINLNDYDIVMYICGDDSDNDESVSTIELLKISEYLSQGGRLFISGSEIGYDLGRPNRPDLPRYNFIFKSNYLGDDAGILECTGTTGTVFNGLDFKYGSVTADTYIEDWPDYIEPFGGSSPVLNFKNTSLTAAIAHSGYWDPDSLKEGRLVYFAFPFETIYPEDSRTMVMNRILAYFGTGTRVDNKQALKASSYFLAQNYPNPFNPVTKIEFGLANSGNVKIEIFNVLGQHLVTLIDEKRKAGQHAIEFDGSAFASGTYFYRIKTRGFNEVRKMLLIK